MATKGSEMPRKDSTVLVDLYDVRRTRWVRFLWTVIGERSRIIISTHGRAAETKTELRIAKNCTPLLPAGVPRLNEGHMHASVATLSTQNKKSTHTKGNASSTSRKPPDHGRAPKHNGILQAREGRTIVDALAHREQREVAQKSEAA